MNNAVRLFGLKEFALIAVHIQSHIRHRIERKITEGTLSNKVVSLENNSI